MDPAQLYTLAHDVAASLEGHRPVLVHLLEGYVDAGQVGAGLAEHLLGTLKHEVLVEFDHDQLHDYRSRRPQLTFDTNQWVSAVGFQLAIHRILDAQGRPFLLLSGPEPDTQWNRFTRAVLDLVDQLGVSQLITANGVPMGVPHTRPVLVTGHSTDPALVPDNPVWIDRVRVPGSLAAVLEVRAGEAGLLGRGFVAHVPHYLAQGAYVPAVVAVLDRLTAATGLDIPPGDLAGQALGTIAKLEEETATDEELGPLISSLEEQYDELQATGRPSVPTADEIGAAVEQFLAERSDETDEG